MTRLYYDSPKSKTCERGCGIVIKYKGKNPNKRGSTGWFELYTNCPAANVEHTFDRCNKLLKIIEEKAKHGTLFPSDSEK